MKDYLLFMDVSGDIIPEYIESGKIRLLPMTLLADDEEIVYSDDGHGMRAEDFYEKIKAGAVVKTSQIPPFFYEDYFDSYLKDGYSVLYLCLSSALSSTYQSALMASQTLKEKYPDVELRVCDTLMATAGMSIMGELMVENKEKGMSLEENFASMERLKTRLCVTGAVDDLASLKRGGRISPTVAFVGTLMNIKPIVEIAPDGSIAVAGKARGAKDAISFLFKCYKARCSSDLSQLVYIVDTGDPARADALAGQVLDANPNAVIRRRLLSPVIGAHLGPGTVVIGFVAQA